MRKNHHEQSPYRTACEKVVRYMSQHHIECCTISDPRSIESLKKLCEQSFLPITVNDLPGLNIDVCDVPCKSSMERGYIHLNGITDEKISFGPVKVLYIQATPDSSEAREASHEGRPGKLVTIMYHVTEKHFNFCIDNFKYSESVQQRGVGG